MLKIFTCFSSKNQFILSKQNYFFNPLFKALNKRFNKHIIFNFCSITPPKGCGKETCSCAGASQESDLEKKLKSINYKILQCINLGHFQEGIELSDQYIAEVEQSFGKEHPFFCSAINNKAFILKVSYINFRHVENMKKLNSFMRRQAKHIKNCIQKKVKNT